MASPYPRLPRRPVPNTTRQVPWSIELNGRISHPLNTGYQQPLPGPSISAETAPHPAPEYHTHGDPTRQGGHSSLRYRLAPIGQWDSKSELLKAEGVVLVIWLLGVGVACSHHVMYWALDGQPVHTDAVQRIIVGAGIMLAMFVKFCFSVVMTHAFTQKIWSYFRQRRWKIRSIDALFQAEVSLRWAMTWEVLRHAPLAAVIALCIWLLKLLAIAPPTTLSIDATGSYVSESVSCNFSSMNFQPQHRDRRWPSVYYDNSRTSSPPRLNSQLERILTSSAHRWDISLPSSPCGSNCSYNVSFYGPAYDCENSPFSVTPWGSDDILRASKVAVGVEGTRTIYISQVIDGTIWFAGSYLKPGIRNESSVLDGPDRKIDNVNKVTDGDYVFQAVQCKDWNASYDVTLSYSGSGSSIRVNNRTLLDPINYVYDDPDVYDETNKAIHGLIARWLEGNVTLGLRRTGNRARIPLSLLLFDTKLTETAVPFGDDENEYFYVVPHLLQAAEELHQNMTLSLLSASPNFYFVTPLIDQKCTVIKPIGLYTYDYHWLVSAYAGAAGVTLVVSFLGAKAMLANGIRYDNTFATIIATTRNPELDALAKGNSLGRLSPDSGLIGAEVRFGDVERDGLYGSHTPRFAFGTTAIPFSKGIAYEDISS